MQLVMVLPCMLHLWLIRAQKKRRWIDGGFSLLLLLLLWYAPLPYLQAGVLLLYLLLDLRKSYLLYLMLPLLFALTWELSAYLVVWTLLEVTFVLQEKLVYRTYEISMQEYQSKVFDRQVQEVEHIFMTMRGWRHDFHHHLQSLKAKLKQGDPAAAFQYLDELEQELAAIRQLVETGNTNMDAILNSKLSMAETRGIRVQVKAKVPKQLAITDTDVCALLGNLLDNALEACALVETDPYIRLYIGNYKGQLYISCTNATNQLVRKLDEDYITTKRGNHGHGLKRMNLIVEKYEGSINRKNEPGVFITEILLPL